MSDTEQPANILISVRTQYVESQSQPNDEQYVFAYAITIKHEGGLPCQLLNRHWVITDGSGEVEEVRGEGVVGKQPHLVAGESFEYTSGSVLKTPVGSMQGEYEFVLDNEQKFLVPIPIFSLFIPNMVH